MRFILRPEQWEEKDDLTKAFENMQWPTFNNKLTTIIIDAPKVSKFVNLFLNSNLNCRVEITPTELDSVNYAGLFSGCKFFKDQPKIENSKNISMAAMFKGCESFRSSLNNLDTSNVVDFRQCFWGANNYSGNGVQNWKFNKARSPDAFRNFFGGGSGMNTVFYDMLIQSLHKQMKTGNLPTPMDQVDMGKSKYSPLVSELRNDLIKYGWNIKDAGMVLPAVEPSSLEKTFFSSIYDRLKDRSSNWLNGIDLSPITKSTQGGILITSKHMMFTHHWMPAIGKTIVFWNGQTAKVESVNVDPNKNGYGDITIVTLDKDVDCSPVLFLPKDWRKACPLMSSGTSSTPFPRGMNTPLVWWDQKDQDNIAVINNIIGKDDGSNGNWIWPMRGEVKEFSDRYKEAITGDSGSPMCFIYNDKLVLSHLITNGGSGSGSFASYIPFRNWLDNFLSQKGYKVKEVI